MAVVIPQLKGINDGFGLQKIKLAMKIGGEYKLSQIGLRGWQQATCEMRTDADELMEGSPRWPSVFRVR